MRLKDFLAAYPEITDDQALAFVKNTGDTLDSLAAHLDNARVSGMSVKDYFNTGRKAALKGAQQSFPMGPAAIRDAKGNRLR